jgi:hypothetical protein
VAKVGLEPTDATTLPEKGLGKTQQSSAAKSGAVSVDTILAMLATLSPEERARLAALLLGGQPKGSDQTAGDTGKME